MIRKFLIFFYEITGQAASLFERANFTAIGFSGHVSLLDKRVVEDRKLQPLNRFERWLLQPIIESEKRRRWEAYRQSVIEVTGEDPGVYVAD